MQWDCSNPAVFVFTCLCKFVDTKVLRVKDVGDTTRTYQFEAPFKGSPLQVTASWGISSSFPQVEEARGVKPT